MARVGPVTAPDPAPGPAADPAAGPVPVVPPLPRALADPRPVVALGTLAWLLLTVVVAVRDLRGDGLGEGFVTCLVGLALGGVGYTIFYLQRRTVRRGGRGQQGIS